MGSILLTTLNARYSHCAFGLRYLKANLRDLKSQADILEFTISQRPQEIAESILKKNPKILGFGVYIWNTAQTQSVIEIIKTKKPDIKIILGGPEVSYETETQSICQMADLTIRGEADFLFYEICKKYLNDGHFPEVKWISGELPNIDQISLPYSEYTDDDIKNRVIYVEASRGCPYKCEYCLSSLDKSVRSFELNHFLAEMDMLITRGVRQFKFIDRTFNLSITTSSQILEFFLSKMSLGLFLHFEMVPDRLPTELRNLIDRFPKGALQFEVGIQTWNPEVAKLVSRRQDYLKIKENFEFLNLKNNVHTHADLIVGLPGETLESFARGFDEVSKLRPDEIQVGLLKRLKGTPIIRHDQEWQMIYDTRPPFQILSTKTMPADVIQEMSIYAQFWDRIANSGNFLQTFLLIKKQASLREDQSLFYEFQKLVRFLFKRHRQAHGIAMVELAESLSIYLHEVVGLQQAMVHDALVQDYSIVGNREIPKFLYSDRARELKKKNPTKQTHSTIPERQQKHLKATAE
jgi:radical SAM superfamily enzyme YgiQ (UPF0313 family)